jgi:hypothetical protein
MLRCRIDFAPKTTKSPAASAEQRRWAQDVPQNPAENQQDRPIFCPRLIKCKKNAMHNNNLIQIWLS